MNCDMCGYPVELKRERYLELRRAGERPRCAKNGCAHEFPKIRLDKRNRDIRRFGEFQVGVAKQQKNGHGGPRKLNVAVDDLAVFEWMDED